MNKQDYLLLNYRKLEYKIRKIKIKKLKKEFNNHINKINILDEKLKEIEKDFNIYYNNNITICKEMLYKTKVGNDISYCRKHLPQYCEKCNYICNINDKTDRLYYNKKYNIINHCKNYQKIYFILLIKTINFIKQKKHQVVDII